MPAVAFVETSLSGSGMSSMRIARDLGCDVIFLTRDRQYYAGTRALDLDELAGWATIVHCDTNSAAEVTRVLSRRGVDAVLSAGEYHVAIAAEVADQLGVAGLSRPAAVTRDKPAAMDRWAAAGVPVARYVRVEREDEIQAAVRRIGFPLVVKPADGTASLDVRLCRSHADVHDAVVSVIRRKVNNRGQRCRRVAVLAAYVPGPEVSVETLSWGGRTHVFGVTAKRVGPPPYFVEVAHAFPAVLTPAVTRACVDVALAGLRAIGLTQGAAHAELILGPDGPVLIEINARPAGDRITELVALSTGVDPLREWVRCHLPGMSAPASATMSRGAAIRYLTPPEGLVTAVGDLAPLRRAAGVHRLTVALSPGDTVRVQRSSHDRPGYLITTGRDAGEALARADELHDRLPVTVAAYSGANR